MAKNVKRDARGRVGAGNELALKHGTRRFQQKGIAPDDIVDQVADIQQQIVTDLGGATELSELERGVVRRLGETETLLQLFIRDFEMRGVITARGRTRTTVLTFLQTLDRWERLTQRLGLKRRTKRVPTIDEFIRQREQPAGEPE